MNRLYGLRFNTQHLKPLFNNLPIDNVPKCFQVGVAGVAVVDVIGVFPNVEGEKRPQIGGYRIIGVFVLCDNKFAIGIG